MSDSIPSATADPEAVDQTLPANAEDRKAAVALSSLNTNEITTEAAPAKGGSAEQEALSKAMDRLEIAAGQAPGAQKTAGPQKKDSGVKKTVKISATDVALLADQLDLHKTKATELLRAHEGDVIRAMRAFISPSPRA
ncbi:hypothetical protein N7532_009460 [Penicillium argentinense]|uniref:Nascent polypeptide-associated complex subunit alpha-like UBA domain-containing protein n=1 Tax=Penicillium argentinense TaxID=1131581 RepID=A0A9W9EZH9_9EURO|nr:uncharacterized protein N7532_009460 [Penicillium argentinense]KAJ5090776.1 hypothetical protein N7532_009460 [Penicillium argentinense]